MTITTKQAVDKLTAELKADPEFYYVYQANIAMAFFDQMGKEAQDLLLERGFNPHEIANEAAKRFLNTLCQDAAEPVRSGTELIEQERQEQINKHGWDETHDDTNKSGELAMAASFCLRPDAFYWPWNETHFQHKILAKSPIERLTVAGAFCAAEIDRLLRKESRESDLPGLSSFDDPTDVK